jgi:hypothetical protein
MSNDDTKPMRAADFPVCAEARRVAEGQLAFFGQMMDAKRQREGAAPHPDDVAVDRFAAAMKEKLAQARAKGRGGWDDPAQCSVETLARMLVEHVAKGDPRDVANFAMMLWARGAGPEVLAAAVAAQPLTDERIKDIYVRNHWYEMGQFTWGACAVVVRAIERELRGGAATATRPSEGEPKDAVLLNTARLADAGWTYEGGEWTQQPTATATQHCYKRSAAIRSGAGISDKLMVTVTLQEVLRRAAGITPELIETLIAMHSTPGPDGSYTINRGDMRDFARDLLQTALPTTGGTNG